MKKHTLPIAIWCICSFSCSYEHTDIPVDVRISNVLNSLVKGEKTMQKVISELGDPWYDTAAETPPIPITNINLLEVRANDGSIEFDELRKAQRVVFWGSKDLVEGDYGISVLGLIFMADHKTKVFSAKLAPP